MELKVMSFNLRTDTPKDGINAFSERYPRVLEVIRNEKPDLIGFQEVKPNMRSCLREHLPEYTFQGCGRNADGSGESMLIAYRTDETELLSLENFWLSHTPNVPGSSYGGDQSSCPRMALSALLLHCPTRQTIRLINTHLDHRGNQAKLLGSVQLVQYLSTHNEHFALTGDFNAKPTSNAIQLITSALAYRGVKDCTSEIETTFHGYGTMDHPVKIDYIFSDLPCSNAYFIPDAPVNGQYYSDHYAVCAMLTID